MSNPIVVAIEYLYAHRDILKADLRGGGRGRPSQQITGVNNYQRKLEDSYEDWTDETAEAIDEAANAEDQKKVIDERLAILLLLLIALGRKRIPQALAFGLGAEAATPEAYQRLAKVLADNERYLAESLIPAIRAKLDRALLDADIQLAFEMGEGAEVIRAVLATLSSRVASYAGQWWQSFNWGRGSQATTRRAKIVAYLDKLAQHCRECPEYQSTDGRDYESFEAYLLATNGRVPGDFECRGNCRCWLEVRT